MGALDWMVVGGYFLLMVGIGWWAKARVHDSRDFFTAGGRMPWWLSGISHHMSGYSAAVFVGYAAIAYTEGFVLYIWWALGISAAMVIGAFLFVPRWPRLRQRLGIISPLEYLKTRYGLPTQQLLAWSGTLLKVFDVGAKWTATALLLNVFAGVPIAAGVLLTGGVTLIYSAIGGLWADALTDLGQFLVQLVAGIVMFVTVLVTLDGVPTLWTMWDRLPEGNSQPFNGQYTLLFVLVYLLINTLSYNGGTWNLAQRFIASPTGSTARRAALFSASLYLVWPLVMFLPMWAAPILLPDLEDPQQSYALLTQELLPVGLVGLVLAGLFAHTMAMTGSDANAISSVVTRDIIPAIWRRGRAMNTRTELAVGRIAVAAFIALSMVIALTADSFGGVLGLIILWFGGLVGPIAVPMLLGLLPAFKRCGPVAAISSWAVGLAVFALTRYVFDGAIASLAPDQVTAVQVGGPVVCSIVTFLVIGLVAPWRNAASDELVDSIAVEIDASVVFGDERTGDERAATRA
ncbi:Na+/solute symporter [Beutenbergia cavernae DSM 12333]|uniref:Na+/solute symporter n=1 Tax=Beutenbergia cavernae (strain ATCC BAA-8 / DSM 12333 / CCUG 43141 / JCM 11478 / NBRC 16432 / NCIMB 13614 / HKI 0122) TaxID=471853 RepID=C5C1I8_BEUC1|nr:sodium:solute symporter family protein [Beutenbergia cavernae]ACQ81598.1 Na+/solute symporter [Beutenbergia cavernae DSM 12333]